MGQVDGLRLKPDDVRIVEQLEQIADDFRNHYCKWPDQWDEEKEGMELSESDICDKCPMSRI